METLKEILKLYQKYIDRAEFLQKQDQYENAIQYYEKAIMKLYDAKECCQYSEALQETANNNVKFKNWLGNKINSIEKQINYLLTYKQQLQQSVNYINGIKMEKKEKTPSVIPIKQASSSSYSSSSSSSVVSDDDTDTPESTSYDYENSENILHTAQIRESSKKLTNSDNDDDKLKWKELSQRTIKFLCHLRGKYDFGTREDKEFHEILNYQRRLMK
jgi:tetratricopeptide (TPR) repeat protein